MRVRVDRGAEAVHIALTDAAPARRAEVGDGVAVAYDAGGRVVGLELRGVDPTALHEFAVDLTGVAEPVPSAAAAAPAPSPAAVSALRPPPPAPTYYEGPVGWEPEAEAAAARAPFFRRGPVRLAAIALARQRGLDRVTAALVAEVGGG